MTLTQEQIIKLSEKLWKIYLDEPKLTEDLNNILGYMNLLNEIDTTWVSQTISVVENENILREDKILEKNIKIKDLLDCSPQKVVANQISISNIMN